ncbi:MAG: nitronate monooxygenase family protein [Pseudomonadota bacterium]|nr:nitronate monooxygenase family protein [Pseudomonadales bacterium]MEC7767642.1 nitronate monooxygenase family protein [Pseudomonadota bacterium]HAI15041.1 nitronate monooxygenase [Gammaproteobacteria bacterium]MEC8950544.1 nitronate monooxygenase family protein [Pseudomonadota bacterium]MEC8994581.1 nitronate monooxygenase family protein [Pseudomonadota bacterium]|tara:strand:+ start:1050 stop:2027 length:978 start_codon:yes stop_codon:yes gene_type:complete
MQTRVTEMLGIKHPVVQGGMQWVGLAGLASAVSNAGGLGIITGLTQPTPEDLVKEIALCREMTDKPFAVNLTILPTIKPVPYEEYAQAIVDSGIKIVETAGRNPEPFLPLFKGAGITVIHKCTSIRHSLKAERIGCDMVSVDGFECAGHPGEDDVTNMILLPLAARRLKIPFLASGGLGDGRGLAAALAMGADGMNMGTRFMVTKEAPIHEKVKQKMVEASELDTSLIYRTLRNTARVFKNDVAEQVLEIEAKPGETKFEDIQALVAGVKGRELFESGDLDNGIWSAGMVVGLIDDIPSCEELIIRIVEEAEAIINQRLGDMASA